MYGTLISSVTVGAGGAASIDFTSIPQTYTDLVLVLSGRTTKTTSDGALVQINGDTSSANYTYRWLYGDGSAAQSGTGTLAGFLAFRVNGSSTTANTFGNGQMYIPNYTSSIAKIASMDAVDENNATAAFSFINAGSWSGTAAITSIKILNSGYNLAQYSTAYLYGLLKGSGGATAA